MRCQLSVDLSLTVYISGDVVLEVLLVLVVVTMLVVLVKMAVLVVLAMMAVLDVLIVTVSSCFVNMTTTPMRVPNATNTNDATQIIMNFPYFTNQPARASLFSPS
jgi:ABC-type transport system involved in multi-copper enzyme maturation permease subunit